MGRASGGPKPPNRQAVRQGKTSLHPPEPGAGPPCWRAPPTRAPTRRGRTGVAAGPAVGRRWRVGTAGRPRRGVSAPGDSGRVGTGPLWPTLPCRIQRSVGWARAGQGLEQAENRPLPASAAKQACTANPAAPPHRDCGGPPLRGSAVRRRRVSSRTCLRSSRNVAVGQSGPRWRGSHCGPAAYLANVMRECQAAWAGRAQPNRPRTATFSGLAVSVGRGTRALSHRSPSRPHRAKRAGAADGGLPRHARRVLS